MEDEFYCDLLRDYDGKLLEIKLDDDNDKGSPHSRLVVACSDIDISLAVPRTAIKEAHESPKQHSALGFESEEDEDEWLRFVLSNFDLDAILSELDNAESKENGGLDQTAASILDVSIVDIDYDGEDKDECIATNHGSYAEPPSREFEELLVSPLSPTPTPALRPTSWSTGAALIRYRQQLEGIPVEPSTVTLLPPSVNFSVECQHPQCAQTAVIMNLCYEHADLLFAEEQQQLEEPQTKTRKKRRRAVFSTGTKKKKKKAKTTPRVKTTTVKKPRKPRAAQSAKKATQKQQQQQQQQVEEDGNGAPKDEAPDVQLKNPPPPRSRRNRRISYGDAA